VSEAAPSSALLVGGEGAAVAGAAAALVPLAAGEGEASVASREDQV